MLFMSLCISRYPVLNEAYSSSLIADTISFDMRRHRGRLTQIDEHQIHFLGYVFPKTHRKIACPCRSASALVTSHAGHTLATLCTINESILAITPGLPNHLTSWSWEQRVKMVEYSSVHIERCGFLAPWAQGLAV
jgi:molybdopterin-biosynthesis enzyme MoeA-like protein